MTRKTSWLLAGSPRAAVRGLILLGLAFSLSPVAAHTVDEVNLTKVTVCNRSAHTLSVAILSNYAVDPRFWLLQSPYNVGANNCQVVATVKRGYIYYTAASKGGTYGGKARRVCMSTRPTYRLVFSNERCMTGEFNAGFHERLVDQPDVTIEFR